MSERPLWAPWRIEYIKRPPREECIFCAAAGADPEHVVLERGEGCFTLLNAYPYASGHVMVAPLRHVPALTDLDDEELLGLMRLSRRATRALAEAMSAEGFNVGLNLGVDAGAGVAEHLHMHVVPRWRGDNNFMPVLADTRVLPQSLAGAREVLLAALERLPADWSG
ncbi:MAG TPA: HIT domain-containing protein [Solirubrobacteraceae bacterium]|nr:HIT domain-containing protein [Solirubrobacteraceae bacterium]